MQNDGDGLRSARGVHTAQNAEGERCEEDSNWEIHLGKTPQKTQKTPPKHPPKQFGQDFSRKPRTLKEETSGNMKLWRLGDNN